MSEGSGENIFAVRDGVTTTPPISAECLHDITRDTAMTLLRDAGHQVVEADLDPSDLFDAEEIFLTGTAAEVTPVRVVNDRMIIGDGTPGPVTLGAVLDLSTKRQGRL